MIYKVATQFYEQFGKTQINLAAKVQKQGVRCVSLKVLNTVKCSSTCSFKQSEVPEKQKMSITLEPLVSYSLIEPPLKSSSTSSYDEFAVSFRDSEQTSG